MEASFRSFGEETHDGFKERDSFCQAQVKGRGEGVKQLLVMERTIQGVLASTIDKDSALGIEKESSITGASIVQH